MDMEGALRARIVALATAAAARVYWVDRPQGTNLPSVTLQVVTGDYSPTYNNGLQTFRSPRVQLDAWATTYAGAKAIVDAIIAGLTAKQTGNGIYFDQIEFEGERDGLESVAGVSVYRRGIDLIVWHSPA